MNLATLMKRQGYATACVGKWHQGMSATAQADGTLKMTPVDFGFDYYFGFDAPEQGPYAWIENNRFVVAPTETIEDHPGEGVTNPETQGRIATRFGGTGLEVRGLPFHHRRQGGRVADENSRPAVATTHSSSTTPSPHLTHRGQASLSSKTRAAPVNTATM